MILLLDTSTATCRLTFVDGATRHAYDWEAGRGLARGLHAYLRDRLAEHGWTFADIAGIGVMKGPGSFTGLRIGATVMNTIADSAAVPIVGTTGDDWQDEALARLMHSDNDRLVVPFYGRPARITTPRK